jgi:hypothetical protein
VNKAGAAQAANEPVSPIIHYEYKAFPKMIYHVVHGSKIVQDEDELDEAIKKGWSASKTAVSREQVLTKELTELEERRDAIIDELAQIERDKKPKKAVLAPKEEETPAAPKVEEPKKKELSTGAGSTG